MSEPAAEHPDQLSRFLLEAPGVRGVHVGLDRTWQEIGGRRAYPPQVAQRLGETCAAAALFTGHAKISGRLSVQLRGDGPLRILFAECTSAGTLRGLAQYSEPLPQPLTPRAFGPGSIMAITIETVPPGGRDLQRYQGLVALGEDSLAAAFEQYFAQSEQLPTRLLLAAGRDRAAGLMLQQLPGGHGDPDGWRRCCALFDTLGPEELLATGADALLHRLFHEEDLRRLDRRGLRFACSCSRARVAEVLGGLGREEALAACQEGLARIHCDFCGQEYLFSRDELVALFDRAPGNAPGSDRLQ